MAELAEELARLAAEDEAVEQELERTLTEISVLEASLTQEPEPEPEPEPGAEQPEPEPGPEPEVAQLLRKAAELLTAATQQEDGADARAHYQASLSIFEAALGLDPGSVAAQRGQAQATKGVRWNAERAAKSAEHRRNAHRETRMRGSRWLGQGDFD